jgi:hypothetical protein
MSLPPLSSWLLPLRPPGCCLCTPFPIAIPRCLVCLVLWTWSVMTRSLFLVYMSRPRRPPSPAAAGSLADSADDGPIPQLSPRSALTYIDRGRIVTLTSAEGEKIQTEREHFATRASLHRPLNSTVLPYSLEKAEKILGSNCSGRSYCSEDKVNREPSLCSCCLCPYSVGKCMDGLQYTPRIDHGRR